MTKPALDGKRAKSIAVLLDLDAAAVQELIGQMIDDVALKQETRFFMHGAAARRGITELRKALDALKDGDYVEAERLLGMHIDH